MTKSCLFLRSRWIAAFVFVLALSAATSAADQAKKIYQLPAGDAAATLKRELTLPLYLMALLVGTALALWWLQTHHAAAAPHALWLRVGAFLLVAIPVSEAVVAVINRLISESLRPTHLARLALAHGIPPRPAGFGGCGRIY